MCDLFDRGRGWAALERSGRPGLFRYSRSRRQLRAAVDRDAADPRMVQMRVGLARGPRLLPFDQIDPRRTGVVTQRQQSRARLTVGNVQADIVPMVPPLAEVEHHLETQQLIARK